MGRKKLRGRGKKKTNTKLKADSGLTEGQISLANVQSTTAKKSIRKTTLKVGTLSQTELPTTQRRSNRIPKVNDRFYNCKICRLKFPSEYDLRRHLDYYGDPTFVCNGCNTKFTDRKQLETHYMNSHGNHALKFALKCVVCSQMFTMKNQLQAHVCHYHGDCKVSTKAKDKVESVIATESPKLAENSTSCMGNSKDMTNKQCLKIELNLVPELGTKNNILLAEGDETATATVFVKPVDDGNIIYDKRPRTEEKTVPTLLQSTDDLRNVLNSNCTSQAVTRKNRHSICEDNAKNHELKDNEKKWNSILTINKRRILSLEPEMEDGREDRITEGGTKIVPNMETVASSPRAIKDKDDSYSSVTKNTETIKPASEKYEKLKTSPIAVSEASVSIINGITLSVATSPVSNDHKIVLSNVGIDEPQEQSAKLESFVRSFQCVETDSHHNIRVSKKSLENEVLVKGRSNEDKIDALPTDSEKNLRDNPTDNSRVNGYEKEAALRILHSCKDCYVPLVRVEKFETSSATANMPQSQNKKFYIVFPSVLCDQIFSTRDMMFRHYRLMHLKYLKDQIHCVCGKKMTGDEVLQSHFYKHCQKTILSATKPTNVETVCTPLERKFACTRCDMTFWLESCLKTHLYNCSLVVRRKLTKKALIPTTVVSKRVCAICCEPFRSEAKLIQHENVYSRVANYRCGFCETMFYGIHQWRCHMATAHNPVIKNGYDFECAICNQRFTSRRLERIHRMHIHEEATNLVINHFREPLAGNLSPPDSDDPGDNEVTTDKCNVCNIVFSNKKRLIDHTIYYMTSETIYCKTCGEEFKGQYRAHHHNKTVHYFEATRKAYTHHCNVCKEGFMYMSHLQAHMFHVHASEARDSTADKDDADTDPIICGVCDVKFTTTALLAAHETEFADDGEYLCNRCSKKCRTPSLLLDHLTLNHSNNVVQGGVKCRRCNENFLTPSAWVSHVKHIHSPNEPSEFYFEKNVASTESSGDIRYELIPTNDSISSGVAYFKVKNSINFPMKATTTYTNEQADKKSYGADAGELIVHGLDETEKTDLNDDESPIEIENVTAEEEETEDEVRIMSSFDKTSKGGDEQEVNGKLDSDAGQTNLESPEKNNASTKDGSIEVSLNWDCTTCGYPSRGPANLAKHIAVYVDYGEHMCETCGRRFEVYKFYQDHITRHTDWNKYAFACLGCNEGFDTHRDLKMHLAHLHPGMPSELIARVDGKDPVVEPPPLLRCSVKKSLTPARTYSRKQRDQTEKVVDKGEPSSSKIAEAPESSYLHTEIFEDEISMIYECPNCQEKCSSLKRLNEHLTVVHQINSTKKEPVIRPKFLDAPVTCDVCDKVFANKNILITHREKIHFIQSTQTVKSPVPVLEITVPKKRQNDTDSDQPVVIGRLYKLEEISAVPKPVNDGKNDSKKSMSVTRIGNGNVEQQKPLPKSIVKIKANAAVRLKPPVETPVPLETPVANAQHVQSLLTTDRLFKSPIATGSTTKPPSVTLVRLKSPDGNAVSLIQPGLGTRKRRKPSTANVGKQLKSTLASVVNEQQKSVLSNIAPVQPAFSKVIPLKLPFQKVVPLKMPFEKFVSLKPLIPKVVPEKPLIEKVTQPNPSPEQVLGLTSLSDRQILMRTLNMGQVKFLSLEQSNTPNIQPQKFPTTEENETLIITSVYSENPSVSEPEIPNDSTLVTVAPSKSINLIEKTNVQSCSNLKSTTTGPLVSTSANKVASKISNKIDPKFDSQFRCNICNIHFMHQSKLIAHKRSVHSTKSSNVRSAVKSSSPGMPRKNSMNQLVQLVRSLPIQPETESNTEDRIPFAFDFESVLIPVSDDDFHDMLDEVPKIAELEEPLDEINPLSEVAENNVPSANFQPAPLQFKQLPKPVNISKTESNRKRKCTKPIVKSRSKRPKGVFDPVAYRELCRQHNLTPKEPKTSRKKPKLKTTAK